jgi:hypothetical protein
MEQQIKAIYSNKRMLRMILLVVILLVSTLVLIQLVVFHLKINSGFFTYNKEVKDLKIAQCISEYTPVFIHYGSDGNYIINELEAEELAGVFCRDQIKRPPLFVNN